MRGEHVPARTRWVGNPVGAVARRGHARVSQRRSTALDPYTPARGDHRRTRSTPTTSSSTTASSANHLDGRARIRLTALEPTGSHLFRPGGAAGVGKATVGGAAARWQPPPRQGRGHTCDAVGGRRRSRGRAALQRQPRHDRLDLGHRRLGGARRRRAGVRPADRRPLLVPLQRPRRARRRRSRCRSPLPRRTSRCVNGVLKSTRTRGSTTTRVYEQSEPTSPYLMTVNIGRYVQRPHRRRARCRSRSCSTRVDVRRSSRAFARQAEMVETFVRAVRRLPFAAGYTVVVCPRRRWRSPSRRRAWSIFGANSPRTGVTSGSSPTSCRTSGSATA